ATAYQIYTLTRKNDGASTTFGLNLIAGCDYYIAKNLSLGAELGFGFSMTSHPDVEDQWLKQTVTTSGTNTSVSYSVENKSKEIQGTSMQVGPNVVGQFKLGWLF
ncbi:MAG: hypothetical protein JJE25_08350, partial [Bacteroidia bacterium]|nr:hypothetical protein [Bacteroidia bacterium]